MSAWVITGYVYVPTWVMSCFVFVFDIRKGNSKEILRLLTEIKSAKFLKQVMLCVQTSTYAHKCSLKQLIQWNLDYPDLNNYPEPRHAKLMILWVGVN